MCRPWEKSRLPTSSAPRARPTTGQRWASPSCWMARCRRSSSARQPTSRRGWRRSTTSTRSASKATCTGRPRIRSSSSGCTQSERSMKRATHPAETAQVGRAVPLLESWLKVTGRAEYTHNLRLPGMLYGKIFRSTVSHGRIKRIDVSAAQALAGVYRVVTGDDIRKLIPEPYYGPAFHDQPILALDKVRYVGEPVAVVLAADPHVAEE